MSFYTSWKLYILGVLKVEKDKLLCCYYVATMMIAVIAIAGFILSIISFNSSIESSSKLFSHIDKIRERTMWVTDPIVKLTNISFLCDNVNKVSCDKPPYGIQLTYTNYSNVPITVYKTEHKCFWGSKPFEQPEKLIEGGTFILAPKESANACSIRREEFKKYWGNKDNRTEVKVVMEIQYSQMGDDKKYTYRGKRTLTYNCKTPKYLNENIDSDSIVELK